MPSRSRSFDDRITISGSRTDAPSGPVYIRNAREGEWGTCDDFVGNRLGINNLNIYRYQDRWCAFSGRWYNSVTGALIRTLEKVPCEYRIAPPLPETKFPSMSFGELDNLATEAKAKTNPGVPSISIPQFVGELRDLPGLVEGWGRGLIRDVAAGHLVWQWVFRPMMRDFWKLVGFAKAVEERLRWLRKLRDGKKGLRRRVTLRKRVLTDPTTKPLLMSLDCWYYGTMTTVYTEKVWASVQWKLLPGAVIPSEKDIGGLKRLAENLTRGFSSYEALSTGWELLPWSWLADWYLGLGTVLQANNSSLPVTSSNICVMRTSRGIRTMTPNSNGSDAWAVPYGRCEQMTTRKERRANVVPVIPFIPTALPLVDPKKWPVIADLVVLRAPKFGPSYPTRKQVVDFVKEE